MSESTTIVFAGDVYLGPDLAVSLHPEVVDVFRAADLVVVNQEGPITDADFVATGKTRLKSSPHAAAMLRDWGVDVATTANNHMFDCCVAGLDETCRALESIGIRHLGAGHNLEEAAKSQIIEVGGVNLGLLAYAWESAESRCATEDSPGCAPVSPDLMARQVRELRDRVDHVIVLPHWGYCGFNLPLPSHVRLADRLVESGASAIVGAHPHVVQGLLRRDTAIIAYSLGNFAFAEYTWHSGARATERSNIPDYFRSMLLRLTLTRDGIESCEPIHAIQSGGIVRLDGDPARDRVLARRTAALSTKNYDRTWRRYTRWRLAKRLVYWLDVRRWRRIRLKKLRGAWIMLTSRDPASR